MMYNVLASTADKFRTVSVGEAALLALLGFVVVFIGIAFLVFVVWAVGKIMGNREKKSTKIADETAPVEDEELSEEIIAVITAAIAAYYQKQSQKCDFTVKRIKRI